MIWDHQVEFELFQVDKIFLQGVPGNWGDLRQRNYVKYSLVILI